MSLVLVFAFDPVPELEERAGLLPCAPELAARLVAEHRVEALEPHRSAEHLRYVAGSPAWAAARAALRQAAASAAPTAAAARRRRDTKE
jgi:hypothetical protein